MSYAMLVIGDLVCIGSGGSLWGQDKTRSRGGWFDIIVLRRDLIKELQLAPRWADGLKVARAMGKVGVQVESTKGLIYPILSNLVTFFVSLERFRDHCTIHTINSPHHLPHLSPIQPSVIHPE